MKTILNSKAMVSKVSFMLILLFSATVVSGQEEYIAISKRGPALAEPGDLISYTITVGNGDQVDWTGTITDELPAEFTFNSAVPAPTTVVGQTLTWTNFTVSSGENRVITVSGYAGRLGSEFVSPLYPDGYYMENSNVVTAITNSVQLANGTSGSPLSDSYSTNVNQISDFYIVNATGSIKMSTGATMRYLVVVQNLGNVWDRFSVATDPLNAEYADCVNPPVPDLTGDNVELENELLALDGSPLGTSDWIAPGETFTFFLQLTTPNGTPANRWNCTDVDVTSEVSGLMKTETFHTATIQPPSDPLLYIYNIDYPDPVACEDTLNYTIYISNQGTDSYNTVVSNIYDQDFEFISSDPAPVGGTDNTWSLGLLPANDYARIDVRGRILPGVVDQQLITDSVIVNYDDGSVPPNVFADTAVTTTTVNAYPDLDIQKIASSSVVRLLDTITYTISYSNMGCGTATGVTISDDFDELRTILVDDGGGTVSSGVLSFDVGTLAPTDGVQSLEYSLVVVDVDCGAAQIENEVNISSAQPDAYVLNNSASTSVLAVSAPTWVSFPADTTVECDNVPDPAVIGELEDVWAEDACARDVTITFEGETMTPGDCNDSYTLARLWRAEDEYGNFSERSQLITVIDTTAPELVCPDFTGFTTTLDGTGHLTVTLEANSGNNYLVSNDDFNPAVLDNCDGAPLLSYTLTGSTTGSGPDLNGVTLNSGTTNVTWIAADQCGNGDTCSYTVLVNAEPSIALVKRLDSINSDQGANTYVSVGDELNYGFIIANTGNVTLYNVSVTDPQANVTGTTIAELAPAAVDDTSFTGSYVVSQADIDRGYFTNIATVAGTAVNSALASDSDTLTVDATQNPAFDLVKTSTTDPNTFSEVGDELTYEILLSNTGNITLNNITVGDSLTGDVWFINTLSPADSELFTTSYFVTQEDLDAGRVENRAYAIVPGLDTLGVSTDDVDEEIINANQLFTLAVTKTVDEVDYVYAGDTLSYTIVLENTGNVNLLNITVDDTLSASTDFLQADNGGSYSATEHTVSWFVDQLSPGQVLSYEIQVVVDAAVENGTLIFNKATTESAQTFLVESDPTELIALQLPGLQLVSLNHVACFGEQNGSIVVDVEGGLAPYTVSWQHDASESGWEVSGLAAGTYVVSVEDALGNTDELSLTIEEPSGPLSGSLSVTDVLCKGESDGSIELGITGGTTPYGFLWSNTATTQDLDAIAAGTYSVIVTDANGCTWSDTATVTEPEASMVISDVVIEDVICMDDPSGSISFEVSGGTTPYQFLWSNSETTQNLSGIPGGEYTVVVTDANGCTLEDEFLVDYQYEECGLEIPSGLTPYGEFDHTWVIKGLDKYPNNSVRIFNRFGTMVYQVSPYLNDWTGEPNLNRSLADSDGKLSSGTYYYILLLEPGDEPMSGYIYIMKE